MNPHRQDQIRRLTEQARSRLGEARAAADRRGGGPPEPGDLYVFPETARFDVQWAVLAHQPPELLVVPADDRPLVGSADVAVPAGASCGALTLRCRFGVWLGEAAFDPEMRTGRLAPEDLERIRRKRAEVERGAVVGSVLERETDGEPEYEDWAEDVLAWAQATLAELGREAPESGLVFASGVYGHTGDYLSPPVRVGRIAAWARGERIDPGVLRLLEHVHHAAARPHLGLEPADPGQAGWGVVFHADETPAVRAALEPLIAHRRERAGDLTKVLEYRGGDWREWLARHGVGAGDLRPERVPYYLLLVGPPTRIPFELQSLLGAQYAVGRLSFEDPGDYRRYADSLVDAEARAPQGRDVVVFAPRHPSDPLTRLTSDRVEPLVEGFAGVRLLGDDATRSGLLEVLHGTRPPALALCAGHGVVWPPGHREQLARQGDLVCQGWTGRGRLADRHCFGAADLTDEARVHGTVAVLLTSYSAGTPEWDRPGESPRRLAAEPFVARLPQRLLAHPRGAALAVVGLVDRAWGVASGALRGALGELLEGAPVGHAVRQLDQRYAALTVDHEALVRKLGFGARVTDRELASVWVERRQARVVVLGDPAARL